MSNKKEKIKSFTGENRFLSNFYPVPGGVFSKEDDILYPTVEHAYQAAKTEDRYKKMLIKQMSSPAEAKKYGRELDDIRNDWKFIREEIMYELCLTKFRIGTLRTKLINTGNLELIEGNNWGDRYWGVCKGKGQNKLGKMLMKIRDELRCVDTDNNTEDE